MKTAFGKYSISIKTDKSGEDVKIHSSPSLSSRGSDLAKPLEEATKSKKQSNVDKIPIQLPEPDILSANTKVMVKEMKEAKLKETEQTKVKVKTHSKSTAGCFGCLSGKGNVYFTFCFALVISPPTPGPCFYTLL